MSAPRQALDDATGHDDARRRLRELIGELDQAGYAAVAACLADDLDALVAHLRYPLRHRRPHGSRERSLSLRRLRPRTS